MSEETGLGEGVQDFIFMQLCNEVYINTSRAHGCDQHAACFEKFAGHKGSNSPPLLTIRKLTSVLFGLTEFFLIGKF